jgi:signal transduction histidine kinase
MRPSRWPIRARLTAMYASVFLTAGASLVAVTYWLVSRSLSEHVDATRTHAGADAALTRIVRDEIAAYRARTLDDLLIWSLLALVATVAIAVVAGWILARRALRPLRHITDTATRIADRNLHERIALTGPHDEVKELADTIDDMLDRLDRSFDAQRRFVANASHELRTPLAVNRTLLEVAASDPNASEDLKRIAPRLLATNERSERLVNGLLTLTRSEQPIEERTTIDLATVAAAVIDQQRHEAHQRGVTITTDLRRAPIAGNPLLVEQLAANLIQNAIRHGSSDRNAAVRTWHRDTRSVLEVENPGPPVTAQEVDRLFEPFQRGNGRTSSDGVGLGLSIVRSVAHAHGGTASARAPDGGGLIVRVELPVHP